MDMKDFINKLKQYDLNFIFTIVGLLVFGVIHMVGCIMSFSWLSMNYMLFCYVFIVIMFLVKYLFKNIKTSTEYLLLAILYIVLLIPLIVTLGETIKFKEPPNLIFDWVIYGYALFAFLKMGFAIKDLIKHKNTEKETFGWLGIVYAAFTMYMLENALITTFDTGSDDTMYMEMASLIAIAVLNLYLISKYFVLYVKEKNNNKSTHI